MVWTMSDDPIDLAAAIIMERITALRGSMGHALGTLEPLEAISLLGFLVADTLKRFPTDIRDGVRDAFCTELVP